jgi:hypothetical protein
VLFRVRLKEGFIYNSSAAFAAIAFASPMTIRKCLVGSVLFGASLLIAGAPPAAQSVAPRMPFEDVGACPFEGCIYRDWIANRHVSVRESRGPHAPTVFTLEKGDHVTAVTGVVVTLKAGRVQFRTAVDVISNAGIFHVWPRETLYLLTYHGEGAWTVWFKGRLYYGVDESQLDKVVEKPQSVWWIRVVNSHGVFGWTREPEKFDNKDQLG